MQKKTFLINLAGVLLSLVFLTSCATTARVNDPLDDNYLEEVNDPLEPVNRILFSFNDTLNLELFFPVANGYRKIVPSPLRNRAQDFFHNLATPIRVAGDLLQLKWRKATIDSCSFFFNSTFGGLGFFDIYTLDDNFDDEDISQGLASQGIPEGLYIVWPFFGSSTLRNTLGEIGNILLSPQTQLGFPTNAIVNFTETTNSLSITNPYLEITDGALDKYSAVRDAYLSNFRARLQR
jgi:phospholipid-binding lipoprotein MlaA